MRQQLLDLYAIQQIDLRIREIEKRKEAIPKKLNELEASIDTTRDELATLCDQRDLALREIKTLEGTVHAETDKMRKWEKRLNEIRNQREYLALSREVEGTKRANRDSEEQILEHMSKKEELERQIETLQDKIAEEEVDRESERGRVDTEVAALDAEVAEESARKGSLLPKIPKNLLKRYEAIRIKRMGQGLVPAPGGSCSGCNMRLPPQLFNTLQRGDSIEQCPSCQRIVFWEGLLSSEQSGGVEATV